ncbi:MAG: magnesium transporter [Pseudohongiellaceae bacterium]
MQKSPISSLTRTFLSRFPLDAARKIESMGTDEMVEVLQQQSSVVAARVMDKLSPGVAHVLLEKLPAEFAARVIELMELGPCIALLARLDNEQIENYLSLLNPTTAEELKALLEYPENTVGRLMNSRIIAFNQKMTVAQALTQLKQQGIESVRHLFLLNDEMQLQSQVDVHRLALADFQLPLASLAIPITTFVNALDPRDEVMEKLEKFHIDVLPVVDISMHLVGVIEGKGLVDAVREDLVADMQTMVGVSKDERALSSATFAIRKRLPWLQINLLTAFLAASVVGLFEATIAQFTALAVLLPIAAGQSGNTGAQALAVTMRGLTLREITLRDWFSVLLKEFVAGLVNGIGIAVVCAGGVYLWSQSVGLALVMAAAMVISMTIAGMSGALVPILLKRFGLDPAQSSSIVLTTVTDVAGFMSFLGIATLMSSMLG